MEFRLAGPAGAPKYRRIVDGVIQAIRSKQVRRGDPLPSITELCTSHGLARETVVKAYTVLKRKGIVRAVRRKGYFVETEDVSRETKVLLLFDEFSAYKQDLYDAFRAALPANVAADIFFHHCDVRVLESMLLDKHEYYDLCIIMPFENRAIPGILRQVPPDKLLMLDRRECAKGYRFVGQDHDASLVEALLSGRDLFGKYAKVNLVVPVPGAPALHSSQAPSVIAGAFKRFCKKVGIKYAFINRIEAVRKGEAYFVIDDNDLVDAVEKAREKHLKTGKDIGILAYNETALRKVIADGITVVSTDFRKMGRLAAGHVLDPDKPSEVVPTTMIKRASL